MLKKSIYDLISKILKNVMGNDLSFGGKRLILVGDLLQLPPILNNSNDGYFFESLEFNLSTFEVVYLSEVHRQNDDGFITFLHSLRKGKVDEEYINRSIAASPKDRTDYTKLFFSNWLVNKENIEHLNKLQGDIYDLKSRDHFGNQKTLKNFISTTLTPQNIILKIGARVIFTRNDFTKGYANGNSGVIKRIIVNPFGEEQIEVLNQTTNSLIVLSRVLFSNHDPNDLAGFYQFPVVLGFALTIHKSQGMTLENVLVDFSGIKHECPHLVYTAFSRVKYPTGLCVKNFSKDMVTVNLKAFKFDLLLSSKSCF